MVLSKVHISSKIRDKLGENGVAELTACLWPVDCQTCNRPLGADPPALLVDDMLAFATASLHHRRCQFFRMLPSPRAGTSDGCHSVR
jgi:hypothetical protein